MLVLTFSDSFMLLPLDAIVTEFGGLEGEKDEKEEFGGYKEGKSTRA